jgi:hypothetical protein
MQPGQYYQPPAQPQRAHSTAKTLLLITVIVVTIAIFIGGGFFIYAATRPDPTISLTSKYHALGLPAGASSTTFAVQGLHFSGNEAITFFLDGGQIFGLPSVKSNGGGSFTVALPISNSWSLGKHVLTASDADHYLTKQGVSISIVVAGQANTPGPNGAPSDSSSFKISASFTGTVLQSGNPDTSSEIITVTGMPDPAGGTVCGENEDGIPFVTHGTFTGGAAGTSYTETIVETCAGTYQGGKLEEDVTVTAQYLTYTDPSSFDTVNCSVPSSYVLEHIQGTFSSATEISGSYSMAGARYSCSNYGSVTQNAEAGAWNGTLTQV